VDDYTLAGYFTAAGAVLTTAPSPIMASTVTVRSDFSAPRAIAKVYALLPRPLRDR